MVEVLVLAQMALAKTFMVLQEKVARLVMLQAMLMVLLQ
jgi:hypothetical protein